VHHAQIPLPFLKSVGDVLLVGYRVFWRFAFVTFLIAKMTGCNNITFIIIATILLGKQMLSNYP